MSGSAERAEPGTTTPRASAPAFFAAAFSSGVAGLVFEILWMRKLAWLLGSTVHALNLVLAVFFLALGAGAFVIGRLADRSRRPLFLFLLLEAGIALYGLGFAAGWQRLEALAPEGAGTAAGTVAGVVAAGAFVALAIGLPAFLMGGTVPVLARIVVRRPEGLSSAVAGLYGLNALGGALGVALAVFALLPRIGLFGGACFAASCNGLAAVLALLGGRTLGRAEPAPVAVVSHGARTEAGALARAPLLWALTLAAGVAGFGALGLEVAWTRALASRLSSTVYSFGAILSTYLACLALGSLALHVLERFGQSRRAHLPAAMILAGLGGLASLFRVAELLPSAMAPERFAELGALHAREVFSVLSLIALATFCGGLAFPLLCKLVHERSGRVGADVGRVYLANTIGAVLGPLIVGYVLFPGIGLRATLVALSWLLVIAGALLAVPLLRPLRRRALAGVALGLGAATAFTLAAPDDLRLWSALPGDRLLHYEEGVASSVAVVETAAGNRILKVDWDYQVGDSRTAFAQRRQGVLPLLVSPRPRRVLVMGLGTGTTAGAMAAFSRGMALDVVELIPELAGTLPYFDEANIAFGRSLATRPELTLVAQDARYFLRGQSRPYDVVVGDLFVPWRAGEAGMYTREHFEAVAGRLTRPHGLFCQWLPLYQLGERELEVIVASFAACFPHVNLVWLYYNVTQPAVGLFGSFEPLALGGAGPHAPDALEGLLAAVDLADPLDLAASWIAGSEALRDWTRGAPIETVERPRVEFLAAASRLRGEAELARSSMGRMFALAERDELGRASSLARLADPTRGAAARAALAHFLRARIALVYASDARKARRELEAALGARPEWTLPAIELRALEQRGR